MRVRFWYGAGGLTYALSGGAWMARVRKRKEKPKWLCPQIPGETLGGGHDVVGHIDFGEKT